MVVFYGLSYSQAKLVVDLYGKSDSNDWIYPA